MNLNNYTIKSQEAIQQAVQLVTENGQQAIEPAHILKAILEVDENITPFIFKKLNVNPVTFGKMVDSLIKSYPKVSGGQPSLSSAANTALMKASSYLKEYNPEKDIEFLTGEGDYVTLNKGSYAIFFPQDAHMPKIAPEDVPGKVIKVVVKVKVD